MTNFLPAGIINETISDISQRTAETRQHLAAGRMEEVARGLIEIENMALDLRVFIEGFSCQPLIYTGSGSTEEVINRLEWALTFMEEDPAVLADFCRKNK
ncbi:MAG TPA: hypothetical protein GX404_00495 [Syntrophomonadaceae bacterium]|nr:hypothetical protein [Syntrophomonadaceae bacterium]